jgi:O-antigen ligase
MLPVTILQYHLNIHLILEEGLIDPENIVNNISYSMVLLMPFVFLLKNKRIFSTLLMLLLMFYVIQGAKRGAIVVGVVLLIIYFYYLLRTVDKQQRNRDYFLVIIGIVILTVISYDIIINNDFLLLRFNQMLEGNISNRDTIYSNIWNSWYYSDNPIEFLFGFGFAGSLDLTNGLYAHNDWLEIISNFGLIGGLLYLYLFFTAFKYCFNRDWSIERIILMLAIVGSWFLTSLFSMWYTSFGVYTQAMLLGYLVGCRSKFLN